jgi:RNA polymerase sigma factor (sigma-70 family)
MREEETAMTDCQLLRRYLEDGSDSAFSELVGRHANLVHSAALRQVGGDFHRADDITQMVFASLAHKARSLTRHTVLAGWLYGSTYFSARTMMRNEQRRQMREEQSQLVNELFADPASPVDWDRLRSVLDGVMLELSERDREAVRGRFFSGKSLASIGENLGVSENTAGSRVTRALGKMRRSLKRRGLESSPAVHAVPADPPGENLSGFGIGGDY